MVRKTFLMLSPAVTAVIVVLAVMGVHQGCAFARCVSCGRGWPIPDLRCSECKIVLHNTQACMDRHDQLHIQELASDSDEL